MPEPIFTVHAKEREIPEQWVLQTINAPDEKNMGNDGNVHYFKSVPERGNRVLHVVVNETIEPNRIITLFLDKRARRTK